MHSPPGGIRQTLATYGALRSLGRGEGIQAEDQGVGTISF